MQLPEWFVSLSITPGDQSVFDASRAEALWSLIIEWAESRQLGIGGSYRLEDAAFLYEYGVCATEEDQLIDAGEIRDLLRVISAAISGRAIVTGGFRPFTVDESDPSRFEQIVESVRKSIN